MPPANWKLPPGVNRALWDYAHNKELARSYDALLAGTPLLNIDLEFAERWFPHPGRVIDLGCGSGRLAVHFAGKDYWTAAVDLSDEMLHVTGKNAHEKQVAVHRLKANLVDLGCIRDAAFDYAACMFSTLGMIVGRRQRESFLRHVHRILRPGGTFVVHVHNRWFNIWNRAGRRWLLRDTWKRVNGDATAGDCVMPIHQGVAGLTLHLFTEREIRAKLERAGFRITEMKPISSEPNGRVRNSWWFGSLRTYGYLIAATPK